MVDLFIKSRKLDQDFTKVNQLKQKNKPRQQVFMNFCSPTDSLVISQEITTDLTSEQFALQENLKDNTTLFPIIT